MSRADPLVLNCLCLHVTQLHVTNLLTATTHNQELFTLQKQSLKRVTPDLTHDCYPQGA